METTDLILGGAAPKLRASSELQASESETQGAHDNVPETSAETPERESVWIEVFYDPSRKTLSIPDLRAKYDAERLSRSCLKAIEEMNEDRNLRDSERHALRMKLCSLFKLPTDFSTLDDDKLADAISAVSPLSSAPRIISKNVEADSSETVGEEDNDTWA